MKKTSEYQVCKVSKDTAQVLETIQAVDLSNAKETEADNLRRLSASIVIH